MSENFKQMFDKGTMLELEDQKVLVIDNEENKTMLNVYNNCVTQCEKPSKDLRLETEL